MTKVLVVDAELACRRRLKGLFEHHGHTVETAGNAVDAIRIGLVLEPDVIVTGWELAEETTGVMVVNGLGRQRPSPAVVFFTDLDPRELATECEHLGHHVFVERRASPATLLSQVERPRSSP